ncbi:Ryncolin-2,Angiopoietin-2,Angiopoietin-related protein 1,Ficolin-2,Ficolin-3,Ryncolin-3,Ficolin-1,Fibrinogen C domain-containing protein 1-B [Mytilus coruscus]|uniref:Ryncolin-2,Angiopoietin-2,Angiopoietin-related protein 1,Ficolin-2,Ficolin-3,Ryncolin-3,Ficolin-1,Fibrinogen C domain-containing protein 1-B n=1 Tax=Mytilus coruscus TaxID=42192 RepID=A0A6J8C9M8_MYTCO|nr:Ryncolin-2,Angiopoietin-2,Angiopoietin-related protein 1,Ficolin-2,Ficolin-3,Ryncolin-3,Ficolin-1,Fibrinogen C domain-containing protein 1-B [Mytilus coruscus]
MDVSRHQQTKFVFLLLIFITSMDDSICTTVRVGKYSVEKNRRVKQTISPVESELAKSVIVCVRRFHGRDDACLADYNPETRTCNIFTSGCCPGNDERLTGFSLFRRDLEGFVNLPAEDCSFYKNTGQPTGVYTIYPEHLPNGISVYCDMDIDEGGWTVIQRRFNGSVDFYRNWDEYKSGFGNVAGEHWLGNEYIYQMTRGNSYVLRIDLQAFDGNTGYVKYFTFTVADGTDDYRLTLGEYCGTVGEDGTYGMMYNNNAQFKTKDKDDTARGSNPPCSEKLHSGWWFQQYCSTVNLNGEWTVDDRPDSINWRYWETYLNKGLEKTAMKIRRK